VYIVEAPHGNTGRLRITAPRSPQNPFPLSHPDELVIEADRQEAQYWTDIWRYRELFVFFAWRDIIVRYKQTVVGISWALIQPIITVTIFTIVFGRIARLPSEGAPYPMLVLAGLLPWQFFADAVSGASNSLISNSNLVSKVYFPRLIVPAAAVVTTLVDFLIAFAILVALMVWYQAFPDWRVLALPLFVLLAAGAAIGAGLWLAALNVKYRDFRFVVPFMLQAGLYISPVGFSTTVVSPSWRILYSLNPMVSVIDGFRWSLLRGSTALYMPGLAVSALVVVVILVSGIHHFRRTERHFADLI